jgi:RNA polymerase primary sigma factor
MPPARRSATKTTAARASSARKAVRARAASTRAATRREVEQSIARFEKQLEGANDALKTLGTHLGRGAQGSYKEVTSALVALRREATKTNKQALKDFDKLRSAVTHKPAAAKSNTRAKASTAKTSTAKKSSGSAKASSSTTRKRATTTRTTAKRSTASRAKSTRAKKTS